MKSAGQTGLMVRQANRLAGSSSVEGARRHSHTGSRSLSTYALISPNPVQIQICMGVKIYAEQHIGV